MPRRITFKSLFIIAVVLLFAYLIYPTIQFNFLMSTEDKAQLKIKDPQKYQKLLTNSIKLGLDLQGGMHVVMEVNVKELLKALAKNKDDRFEKALELAERETRDSNADFLSVFVHRLEETGADLARYYGTRSLRDRDEIVDYLRGQTHEAINRSLEILRNRVDEFGVAEPAIQKQGDRRIIVELAGVTDPERVRALLGKTALLEFRLLKDAQIAQNVGNRINEYLEGKPASEDTLKEEQPETTPGDTSVIKAEELFGKGEEQPKEAEVDTGVVDSARLAQEQLLKKRLFFYDRNDPQILLVEKDNEAWLRKVLEDPNVKRIIEEEASDGEFLLGKVNPNRQFFPVYFVNKESELTGETVTDARQDFGSSYDPSEFGKFIVKLTFNSDGARIFSRVTGANIGKRLAIVLDRRVHSAPVIRDKIRFGQAQITGLETIEEAKDLAVVLRAGALPAPLRILEERTVGPSLGRDSVEHGTYSALIGLLLVALFMIVYYKFSGFVADVALLFNIVIVLGIMSYFHGTLTLPGIAGIILTIGMAVDANVLIFERIREEIDKGKTVWSSIETGYARALVTILDANITTLIAGVVLYNFGSGPVKGFALTLMIGISASMFTAIFVTRTIFEYLLSHRVLKRMSI